MENQTKKKSYKGKKRSGFNLLSGQFWKQVWRELKRPSKERTAFFWVIGGMVITAIFWIFSLIQLG